MGYKRELEHEILPEDSSKEPRLLTDLMSLPEIDNDMLEFDISYPENSISSFIDIFGIDGYEADEDEGEEADSFMKFDPRASPSEFYMSSECSTKLVIARVLAKTRKPVPVGPGHQAELPDPITRIDYLTHTSDGIAQGRVAWTPDNRDLFPRSAPVTCGCFDVGSIPCVRQHVGEARKEMEEELTEPVFRSLGLADMGETVADAWSTKEEAEFYNIVCSNPRSSGRRFWRLLREAFPADRTWGDLVSYYFNVFMLRRRAVQNRLGPNYVDSDDDELLRGSGGLFYEEEEEDGVEGVREGRIDLEKEYLGEEEEKKKGVDDLPAWIEGLLE